MKFKIVIILLIQMFCCTKVSAQIPTETVSICFLKIDLEGEFLKNTVNVEFMSKFTTLQMAHMAFINLLHNKPKDLVTAIPKDTQIISITLNENVIKLNVTKEILNYSGMHTERALIKQLTATAFSIEGVKGLELYIEDKPAILQEGSMVKTN